MLEDGRRNWNECLRCGHSKAHHQTHRGRYDPQLRNSMGAAPCYDCDCPKWVERRCVDCGEFSSGFHCAACYRANSERQCAEALAYANSPEQVAQRERKEQRKWLKEGDVLLKQTRKYLRDRKAPSSAGRASTPDKSSPR